MPLVDYMNLDVPKHDAYVFLVIEKLINISGEALELVANNETQRRRKL